MFRKLSIAALLVASLNAAANAAEETGTFIYVKNGTNKTLKFDLYIECAGQGTGKFDKVKELAPGEVAIWKLPVGHAVATKTKDGHKLHGVGLVGTDGRTGQSTAWGVVGGAGMEAKVRDVSAVKHILVQAIGQL